MSELAKKRLMTFGIVFAATLAGLALHQTVIAPRIAAKLKAPAKTA